MYEYFNFRTSSYKITNKSCSVIWSRRVPYNCPLITLTLRMHLMCRNPTPYLKKWVTCLQLMFFNGGTLSAGLPIWWSDMSCIIDIFVGYVLVEGSVLSALWRKPTKSPFCPSKPPLPLLVPLAPLPCRPLPLPGHPLLVPPLPGPPLCSNKCTVPNASAKKISGLGSSASYAILIGGSMAKWIRDDPLASSPKPNWALTSAAIHCDIWEDRATRTISKSLVK